MRRGRTVIIGAGVNGLAALAKLEDALRDVVVIDRRETIGGAASLRPHTDGPILLTGEPGGRGILLHRNIDRTRAELHQHATSDAEPWRRYRAALDSWTPILRGLLYDAPPDLTSNRIGDLLGLMKTGGTLRRLGGDVMMELMRIAPMCLADWLNEYFDDERLKAGLALPAVQHTWLGPWSPQSVANLLRREALADARHSVDDVIGDRNLTGLTHLGVGVAQIVIERNAVVGVRLDDDSFIEARTVISTADPVHTFRDLVEPRMTPPEIQDAALHYRVRGSAAVAHLTTEQPLTWTARPKDDVRSIRCARIVTTLDDLERAFDPIKYRTFGEHLAYEVHQVSDDRATVTISFVPYDLDGGWTEDRRKELAATCIRTISDHVSNPEVITDIELFTPADIEREYGHTGGHLEHGELALDQMLIRPWRQCARYETPIKGLYLGGGGVHPGGCATGIPGRCAAIHAAPWSIGCRSRQSDPIPGRSDAERKEKTCPSSVHSHNVSPPPSPPWRVPRPSCLRVVSRRTPAVAAIAARTRSLRPPPRHP